MKTSRQSRGHKPEEAWLVLSKETTLHLYKTLETPSKLHLRIMSYRTEGQGRREPDLHRNRNIQVHPGSPTQQGTKLWLQLPSLPAANPTAV